VIVVKVIMNVNIAEEIYVSKIVQLNVNNVRRFLVKNVLNYVLFVKTIYVKTVFNFVITALEILISLMLYLVMNAI
jgi:hypothetical protein